MDEARDSGKRTKKGDWVSFSRGNDGVVIGEAMGFTKSTIGTITVHTSIGTVYEESVLEIRPACEQESGE